MAKKPTKKQTNKKPKNHATPKLTCSHLAVLVLQQQAAFPGQNLTDLHKNEQRIIVLNEGPSAGSYLAVIAVL